MSAMTAAAHEYERMRTQRNDCLRALRAEAGMTLEEIGGVIGLTRKRVRQLLGPRSDDQKGASSHDGWVTVPQAQALAGSSLGVASFRQRAVELGVRVRHASGGRQSMMLLRKDEVLAHQDELSRSRRRSGARHAPDGDANWVTAPTAASRLRITHTTFRTYAAMLGIGRREANGWRWFWWPDVEAARAKVAWLRESAYQRRFMTADEIKAGLEAAA